MTVETVMQYLDHLIEAYFHEGNVYRAGRDMPAKKNPRIMLSYRSLQTSWSPASMIRDGRTEDYYPFRMTMEIRLSTDGNISGSRPGMFSPATNTALSDLNMLVLYLGSEDARTKHVEQNISLTQLSPVMDITAINDASQNEYMAMTEYTVTGYLDVSGWAGMLDGAGEPVRNYSGAEGNGLERDPGYFETVELEKQEEKDE